MTTGNPALTITKVRYWPVDVPLRDTFATASGSVEVVQILFVRVDLAEGVCGYGECAPFPEVTGETRKTTIAAIESLLPNFIGKAADQWQSLATSMREAAPRQPAARCGLETAILDALCRSLEVPMWQHLGGQDQSPYETDVTIPILAFERCLELARKWYTKGFRIFKLKVGLDLDSDLRLIDALGRNHPDISFVLDANEGFDDAAAQTLIKTLRTRSVNVRLIEQPVPRADLEGLARLRAMSPYPICADESMMSYEDAETLIAMKAVDVVNIKIMKLGVDEAIRIAELARKSGIGLMYGGMVETRLAMSCSLCLATLGGVHTLDLDTPLLITEDPIAGGFQYDGPKMYVGVRPGLGCEPR